MEKAENCHLRRKKLRIFTFLNHIHFYNIFIIYDLTIDFKWFWVINTELFKSFEPISYKQEVPYLRLKIYR